MTEMTDAPANAEQGEKAAGKVPSEAARERNRQARKLARAEGKNWKELDQEAKKAFRKQARKA